MRKGFLVEVAGLPHECPEPSILKPYQEQDESEGPKPYIASQCILLLLPGLESHGGVGPR